MKRCGPLHKFPDARVDAALFFIPPHRLRPIDVDFITELSELVPVVREPLPGLCIAACCR